MKRCGGSEAADGPEPAPPRLPACNWVSWPSLLRCRLLPGWLVAAAALMLRRAWLSWFRVRVGENRQFVLSSVLAGQCKIFGRCSRAV